MKWWRLRRLASAGAWCAMFVGVGVVGGLVLSISLVGIPRAEHPPVIGPYAIEYLDLAAQRSMSDAAWWMVVVTAGSTLMGGLGLLLIAKTLIETRRGAEAALMAAQTGETAVRPFLLVEFAHVLIERDELRLSYKVRNSGASPAYRVAFRVTLIVCSHDGTKRHEHTMTKSRSDIAATAERPASADFDKSLAASASDDYGRLLLEAKITLLYSDIFGREHIETSAYGRNVSYFDLDEKKSLYRDVGKGVGWGD